MVVRLKRAREKERWVELLHKVIIFFLPVI